ncbi:hypothetical protein EXN66_Car001851 [Channa argus]|uniref:Uncharacterized protein n=1 Tax=Channa argus TaxID=215402 RepID=A0A6G1P7J2_CHAAH|nr:hypothetical protein EXN66_Car001851 [Channa argus]
MHQPCYEKPSNIVSDWFTLRPQRVALYSGNNPSTSLCIQPLDTFEVSNV